MPANINGIGTAFYGEADYRPDHSFVTTEWIIFVMLPLVPLRFFRVVRDRAQSAYMVVADVQGYRIVERIPLNIRQVTLTYFFTLGSFAWWSLLVWFMHRTLTIDNPKHWIVIIAVTVILGPVPFWLLWWMRRKATSQSAR
jgi:hypothetical protein